MRKLDLVLSEAKKMLDLNQPEEALVILDQLTGENIGEAIFMKGEIYFKLQKWGEALNHFLRYLEQFPSDKKAESYCVMIQDILGFYHKDLYNP
jgi:tetratricopeptide (TPR) repeat protein